MHSAGRLTLFALYLFSMDAVAGTGDDSVQVKVPTILHFTSKETSADGSLVFESLDTVLDGLEIVNPAIRGFYNDLGNIGSASDPQLFSTSPGVLTESGNHTFDLYKWSPSTIRYYKTNKRFSDLRYHMSGGKEQQITITLAQNILSNWNAGIDFNRQGSLGFLSNAKTFITNFDFFTWFHLPDNRYHAFASATWNSILNEANGGLTSDSLYEHNSFSNNDLKGLEISLIDADQHLRNHIFALDHFFDLVQRKDSSGNAMPVLRLSHHLEYERSSYNYNDNHSDSAFYENDYFSDELKDSLHYDQWINKVSLQAFHTFENFKPVHAISVEVAGGSQNFMYEQLFDTTFNSYFAEGKLRTNGINKKTSLDVSGKYVLSGDNEKDYHFKLSFQFPLIFGASMDLGLQQARQTPPLFYRLYESDHFIWHNEFDKITSQEFFFKISLTKYHFSIGGNSSYIGRYIYMDSLTRPSQSQDSIQVSHLFVRKDFKFWKFRLNNAVHIQETNNDRVRLPEIASAHSLFYEDRLFKKKLGIQVGFDVHYTSAYFSNAYMPAPSVFYEQNSVKGNGYPLVDFFVNFKIKTARLFFKLQNTGDGIIDDNYFNTPAYPMPGMVFQFGINWRFFD